MGDEERGKEVKGERKPENPFEIFVPKQYRLLRLCFFVQKSHIDNKSSVFSAGSVDELHHLKPLLSSLEGGCSLLRWGFRFGIFGEVKIKI